jgi:uncharacterized protein (TIGR00369 family)
MTVLAADPVESGPLESGSVESEARPGARLRDAALPVPSGFPQPEDDTGPRRYLTTLIDGTAAPTPCLERLGLVIPPTTAWGHGRVGLEMDLPADLTLTPGVIFGGYLTCLVDHLASLVMMTVLPDGTFVLTASLSTDFAGPVIPGPVRIEAEVVELGRRLATVEIVFSQAGRVTTRAKAEQVIRRSPA